MSIVRPRAFITRILPDEVLAPLRDVADYTVWPEDGPPPPESLAQAAQSCDGLLCLLTDRIDGALLDRCPNLRVVSQMAVGIDNIDINACRVRNVAVGNTPGVLTETTADLTFALILASARRVVEADRFVRNGNWTTWSPMLLTGPDVHHATIGIIGMGRIGLETARRAHGFQMEILYASRRKNEVAESQFGAKRVELNELLKQSDFVTIHTPLSADTKGLIGQNELELMKTTAILINTARGPIVDERALIKALRDARIAGAGLDVFEVEPLSQSSELLQLPNVTVLPHIGSASVQTRTKMAQLAVANLIAGLNDEPLPHSVA